MSLKCEQLLCWLAILLLTWLFTAIKVVREKKQQGLKQDRRRRVEKLINPPPSNPDLMCGQSKRSSHPNENTPALRLQPVCNTPYEY